jgi:DNA-binding IclR family transcriptional regulator
MKAVLSAVSRSHKIVELLAGRCFDGLTNKELARALNTSAANVSRDLRALEHLGYVQQLEAGRRWTLTTRPLGIMEAYSRHYQALQDRMLLTTRNLQAAARRLEEERP